MSSNKNIFFRRRDENTGQLSFEFGDQSPSENRLPVQKTSTTIPWVEFGTMAGWVNQQPQYYDYLKKSSPKNNAILASKTRYVYGKGLVPKYLGLNKAQKLKLKAFVSRLNKSKVIRKLVRDKNDHNAFAVEIIFSRDRKTIYPAFLPVKNVRISKDEYESDGKTLKPEIFYYTKDWSKGKKAMSNPDFTEFHPFDWEDSKRDKSKRYIIYWKGDGYDDEKYALPDYVGGIPYIDADAEVANFVRNNTKNGFAGGYMVNFFDGEPTEDQKKEIVKRFDAVFHGTDNAGKSIKSFNPEGGKGVEVSPLIDNGQDDRFTTLNNFIRDEIFTAHTISPLVVGMKGENGFSNNADEKRTSIEAFVEDYVYESQQPLNELVDSFLEFNKIPGSAHLQRLDPIKPQFGEATLTTIATRDELREMAGLPVEVVEKNPFTDALNSMSPLLANKILESMSPSEIRSLIGLQAGPNGIARTTQIVTEEFSDDDAKVLDAFREFGFEDQTGMRLYGKRDLYAVDTFDAARQAKTYAFEFANSLENSVLKLLAGDPDLMPDELAEALKVKETAIDEAIAALIEQGMLTDAMELTPDGEEKVGDNEILVVYKYELRSDAPALVKGGHSRKFCEEMVKLSKTRSWTFEDIQNISNRLGYDVFSRRGGWYHNPKTDKNVPYCRHIFTQRLVRRAA
ncbi:MAG: phage portal protein [Bacteroidia bacterium]